MAMEDSLQQAPENSQEQKNIHSTSRNQPMPTKQPFPKVREAKGTIPTRRNKQEKRKRLTFSSSPQIPKTPQIARYTPGPPSKHIRTTQNSFTSPRYSCHSGTIPKVLRTPHQDTLRNRQQSPVNPQKTLHLPPNKPPYHPVTIRSE